MYSKVKWVYCKYSKSRIDFSLCSRSAYIYCMYSTRTVRVHVVHIQYLCRDSSGRERYRDEETEKVRKAEGQEMQKQTFSCIIEIIFYS